MDPEKPAISRGLWQIGTGESEPETLGSGLSSRRRARFSRRAISAVRMCAVVIGGAFLQGALALRGRRRKRS